MINKFRKWVPDTFFDKTLETLEIFLSYLDVTRGALVARLVLVGLELGDIFAHAPEPDHRILGVPDHLVEIRHELCHRHGATRATVENAAINFKSMKWFSGT